MEQIVLIQAEKVFKVRWYISVVRSPLEMTCKEILKRMRIGALEALQQNVTSIFPFSVYCNINILF